MPSFKPLPLLVSAVFLFAHLLLNTEASNLRHIHSLETRYSRAHSLGNNYHFSARDGWQTVNVTNLQYKYRRDFVDDHQTDEGVDGVEGSDDILGSIHSASSYGSYRSNSFGLARRASRKAFNPPPRPQSKAQAKAEAKSKVDAARESKDKNKTSSKASDKNNNKGSNKSSKDPSNDPGKGLTSSVKAILASLKGTGQAEPVTITWYTGHDLENPSCWPNPSWAPTDASFACALTLEGWTTRPKCFKFLELCNTPQKCVFVRVVDSCAGCEKGSKHVDLTQAAFKELASLDEGILQVQMRPATDPDGWLENLWGPKA